SGNPTIAAVIASQADAEAGSDTTKLMTPQRVAQAIAALVPAAVGVLRDYQVFTASGTWTKPEDLDDDAWVFVECWGGGGGGGTNTNSGAGGGGGYNSRLLRAADLGDTVTVT